MNEQQNQIQVKQPDTMFTLFDKFDYVFYPAQVINPHHKNARDKMLKQVIKHQGLLVDDEPLIKGIDGHSIFSAFAFPHTSEFRLTLLEQFYACVAFIDDTYDKLECIDSHYTQAIRQIFHDQHKKIEIEQFNRSQIMILTFLQKIFIQMKQNSPDNWFNRMMKNLLEWFEATAKSNHDGIAVRHLSIDEFFKLRLIEVGVIPALDIIEFAHERYLSDETISHPYFVRIRSLICEHTAISNDCYSYTKECIKNQLSCNFLAVLLSTSTMTFDEAVNEGIERCNDLIRKILELEILIIEEFPDNEDVSIILRGYKEIIQGHLMFSQASARYKSNRSPFADLKKPSLDHINNEKNKN
ncbi:unnamed protein product [Adineta steineri]|uniref:Terpene synthase n=1 Tax=Adineta steineri TaxID=433720 RepID=A0A816AJV7_9BILA|nr:unnamed protein product [Adineta steineri]CAF1356111.1 unnamed protein product [Adineta steineri]CAF1575213.1 unnamed protein product [Adineta steineri]CAF1598595.1 unnamed protein product [Adineta steineri]